eukprot:m51a1_g4687 putative adenylate guanylate cyclase with integral membrane sensor (833) ;mRNA; r:185178-188861
MQDNLSLSRAESSVIVRRGPRLRALASLRPRTLLPVAALALLGAGVICGSVAGISLASSDQIEHELAVSDMGLAARALLFDIDNVYSAMYSWIFWDQFWQYLKDAEPWGEFYQSLCSGNWSLLFYRASAIVFILPNGELLNGQFFVWENYTVVQPVQESLWRQFSRALTTTGKAEGLFYDPLSDTLNVATSSVVHKSDWSGDFVGWIVMARDVNLDLPQSAFQADLCLSLFLHREEMDKSLWGLYEPLVSSGSLINISKSVTGTTGPQAQVQTTPLAGHVATPSRLHCSPMSNVSESSYLGVGGVVADVDGEPVAYLYIRSRRTARLTMLENMEKLCLLCGAALVAHWVAVCVLLETAVLRQLSAFSSQIVSIANSKDLSERMGTRGRNELSRVARAVNELMETLLGQSRRTSTILANMFPAHALQAFSAGQRALADHFGATAFLFVDVCGFTTWSAATPAKRVVGVLNVLYCDMDLLLLAAGATKVRTIGDAYRVPQSSSHDDSDIAKLALALCAGRVLTAGWPLQFRMGAASGPCNGAIVGVRKFSYEMWGPTVSLSQRLQESAEPGEILCSQELHESLRLSEHSFGDPRAVVFKGAALQAFPLPARTGDDALGAAEAQRQAARAHEAVAESLRRELSEALGRCAALEREAAAATAARDARARRLDEAAGELAVQRHAAEEAQREAGRLRGEASQLRERAAAAEQNSERLRRQLAAKSVLAVEHSRLEARVRTLGEALEAAQAALQSPEAVARASAAAEAAREMLEKNATAGVLQGSEVVGGIAGRVAGDVVARVVVALRRSPAVRLASLLYVLALHGSWVAMFLYLLTS